MSRPNKINKPLLIVSLGLAAVIIALSAWYAYTSITKAKVDTATKATTAPTPEVGLVKVKIIELGVEIPVPDSIKDLTYSIKSGKTSDGKPILSASLSTKSLTELDPACANNGLGTISRVVGQYPKDSSSISSEAGSLAKQFPGFFIGYSMPRAYCSKNQDAIQLFRDQYTALSTKLESIAEVK